MKMERNIPLKNYFLFAVILIVTIVLVTYIYTLYDTIQKNKLNNSAIEEYLQIINYNEINDFLIENENTTIYLSIPNNQKTINFEKKFKKLIKKNVLNNNILYLKLNNDEINAAKNKFNVKNIPVIVTYEDGKIKNTFDIKKNNYNISLLEKYLLEEGIIND